MTRGLGCIVTSTSFLSRQLDYDTKSPIDADKPVLAGSASMPMISFGPVESITG